MVKRVHQSLFTCIDLLFFSVSPLTVSFFFLRRVTLEGGDVCTCQGLSKELQRCEDVKPHLWIVSFSKSWQICHGRTDIGQAIVFKSGYKAQFVDRSPEPSSNLYNSHCLAPSTVYQRSEPTCLISLCPCLRFSHSKTSLAWACNSGPYWQLYCDLKGQ